MTDSNSILPIYNFNGYNTVTSKEARIWLSDQILPAGTRIKVTTLCTSDPTIKYVLILNEDCTDYIDSGILPIDAIILTHEEEIKARVTDLVEWICETDAYSMILKELEVRHGSNGHETDAYWDEHQTKFSHLLLTYIYGNAFVSKKKV